MACRGEWSAQERSEIADHLFEIEDELQRATRLYGPYNSPHEGYAVILEQLDSAWDCIRLDDFKQAKKEMIKVAAGCVRFLLDVRTE
jgi:hypothetical protein